jgi:hypothetical protein
MAQSFLLKRLRRIIRDRYVASTLFIPFWSSQGVLDDHCWSCTPLRDYRVRWQDWTLVGATLFVMILMML